MRKVNEWMSIKKFNSNKMTSIQWHRTILTINNSSRTILIIDQDNIVQQHFRLVLLFLCFSLSSSYFFFLFSFSLSLSNKLYTRAQKKRNDDNAQLLWERRTRRRRRKGITNCTIHTHVHTSNGSSKKRLRWRSRGEFCVSFFFHSPVRRSHFGARACTKKKKTIRLRLRARVRVYALLPYGREIIK